MSGLVDLSERGDFLRYIDDISICTVTNGATKFVDYLAMSLHKSIGRMLPIVVINNSDTEVHKPRAFKSYFTEIHNKNRRLTISPEADAHVLKHPSISHCSSMGYGLDHVVNTRFCIVCDDDILFKPTIKYLLEMPAAWHCVLEIDPGVTGHCSARFRPFMGIVDVSRMKSDGIHFYEPGRCKLDKWVSDTGGSFLFDINAHGWKLKHIRIDQFIHHIGHATCHQLDADDVMNENRYRELWET